MVDALDAVIHGLEKDVDDLRAELERMKGHVSDVRAIAFWRRVAQEIWEILPEREGMHVAEITDRIGREFVKEAEGYPGEWGPELLRGVMDQRIKYRKLFAKQGAGHYRRRRPEDDAA